MISGKQAHYRHTFPLRLTRCFSQVFMYLQPRRYRCGGGGASGRVAVLTFYRYLLTRSGGSSTKLLRNAEIRAWY